MELEQKDTEQDGVTSRSWLWTALMLPVQFAVAVARMGVILGAYVGVVVAGGIAGVGLGAMVGPAQALVGGPLAAVMLPIALTLGIVGWFVPATLRIYARGGDPEFDRETPTRLEAVYFLGAGVAAAAGMGGLWAALIDLLPAWPAVVAFPVIVGLGVVAIVVTGGRHVADLFVLIAGAVLD